MDQSFIYGGKGHGATWGLFSHSFFVFFIGTAMVELTVGRCKKIKNSHVLSSRIFIPEKGRLGATLRNGSAKNFDMMMFWILYEKMLHSEFLVLACSVLCQKNRMWTQKSIVFEIGWTWVAGSMCNYSETKDYSHINSENLMLLVLLDIWKTSFQNFRSSFFRSTTQKFFFRHKNPGRMTLFLLVFATTKT